MGRGGRGSKTGNLGSSNSSSVLETAAMPRTIKRPDMSRFEEGQQPLKVSESSWSNKRIVTFDVESTGVDTDSDRIVTASAIFVGGGHPTVSKSWLINPGIDIPKEAAEIHGITNEQARQGQAAKEAIAEITELLAQATKEGLALVAFNARFDITILDREAKRHGIEPLSEEALLHVVDPYVLDKELAPRVKGSGQRKLVATCERYDIPFDESAAHDADVDSLMAARLAYRMCHRRPDLLDLPLPELAQKQETWAREQAIDLQEFFDSVGKEANVVPEWPLMPEPKPEEEQLELAIDKEETAAPQNAIQGS